MYRQLKDQLLEDLQAELRRMLVVARVNAHEAQQEANYHIGAMESRYDTFKEEAQYLTEAQNAGTSAYTLGQPFKLGQFRIDRLNIRSACPVVIPRAIPL